MALVIRFGMKVSLPVAVFIVLAFLLIIVPFGRVQGQVYIQYKVMLSSDGSAVWAVTEVSNMNGTVDSLTSFQGKVDALLGDAAFSTNREMAVDNNSFVIDTSITSSSTKTTEYMFTWLNFSRVQNGQMTIGDVFSVPGFFNRLYGDGALQISYPTNCTLEVVTPVPDQTDPTTQTLQWLGTQFFETEHPNIVLQSRQSTGSSAQPSYLLEGSVSAVAVAITVSGLFLLVVRRKKQNSPEVITSPAMPLLETDEEKIVRILRSSGGSLFQSSVTDQSSYSKAKVSQLLTLLETKGVVKRHKKGRDKIVDLIEKEKGKK